MAKIFDVLMTNRSQLKGDAAVRHGRIVLNLLLDLVVSKVNNAGTYNGHLEKSSIHLIPA